MHLGLALSFLIHAGLLAWAIFIMRTTSELPSNVPEPIAIAMISPSDLLRLKKGDVNAKELEAKATEKEPKPHISKKKAEKPKPKTAPEPPAPEPEPVKKEAPKKTDPIAEKIAALPEPKPGPSPEELKKLEAKKKAEAEAKKKAEEKKKKAEEAKRKAEAKKKAEKKKKAEAARKKKLAEAKRKKEAAKKKKAEADRLAALLDKDPTKRGAPQSSSEPTKPTDYKGPTAGADKGNDSVLSVREQDLLLGRINAQLTPCSKMPGGGGGIDTPRVTVRWRLRPDGSIEGEPEVLNRQDTPLFRIAADASVNAVKKCSPLDLPQDKYSAWQTITWDFDWPRILGLR